MNGKYYEKKSQILMEADGYRVERAMPKVVRLAGGRMITIRHDFFNLFDLICINEKEVKFIQVKAMDGNTHGHNAKVRKFLAAFPHPLNSIELHIWRKEKYAASLTREVL